MWTALDAALPAIDNFVGRQLLYPEVMISIFIPAAIIIIVPRLRGAGELCRNKAPPALNFTV